MDTDISPDDAKGWSYTLLLGLSSWTALKDRKWGMAETLLGKDHCIPNPLAGTTKAKLKSKPQNNQLYFRSYLIISTILINPWSASGLRTKTPIWPQLSQSSSRMNIINYYGTMESPWITHHIISLNPWDFHQRIRIFFFSSWIVTIWYYLLQ